MIVFVDGDLFDSPAQVLTNTVNCVGVMGKGIALEFKRRFPEMFDDYKERCKNGQLLIGEPYLWEDDRVQILNFPTKKHWRDKSDLDDIAAGLKYLADNYMRMGIYTLALAPLGCGNGGLNWPDVKKLMVRYLGQISDLEVFAYQPRIAGAAAQDNDEFDDHDVHPFVTEKLASGRDHDQP